MLNLEFSFWLKLKKRRSTNFCKMKLFPLENFLCLLKPISILVLSLSSIFANEDDPYSHIVNLDQRGDVVLNWRVDFSATLIYFNITVRTKGYVGFGLSAKGTETRADFIIGGVAPDGSIYFTDRHSGAERSQTVDESQDWNLISGWENDTHTSLHFSRLFDTCDEQDFIINDDAVALIWAYGESDTISYHFQYKGHQTVYLLDADLTPRMIQEQLRANPGMPPTQIGNLQRWTVTKRMEVPARETTYWCSFHKGPVLPRKHHIVGFHARFENEVAAERTHHILLYRCTPPESTDSVQFFDPFVQNSTGELCYFLSRHTGNLPVQYCRDIKLPYAIGQRIFFLPENTGISIGDDPHEYFLLQVHYDNPNLVSNIEYNVNLDMYYTSELREHETGIITVGHHIPGAPSILIPPSELSHSIYGHCGEECTREILPSEGINMYGFQLHTHHAGAKVRLRHFRGNMELPWVMNDDNYSNTFHPTRLARSDKILKPGDHLVVRCVYDNTKANGSVIAGFSTRQEMCLTYVWYYNKLNDISLCRSEIVSTEYNQRNLGYMNATWDELKLDFVATYPENLAGMTLKQLADARDWTVERRDALQRDHQFMEQVNDCSRSPFSSIGQGQVEAGSSTKIVSYPIGVQEYTPPVSKCQTRRNRASSRWSRKY